MAGKYPGIAKLHRAFGNSLDRYRAEGFVARTHWRIEVVHARDAGRGGALAHPSDSRADRRYGRRPEWCCRPAGYAANNLNLQNEAPGNQFYSKLISASASRVGGMSSSRAWGGAMCGSFKLLSVSR